MKQIVSPEEREEVVTKGFLVDYMQSMEYVTESRLKEILDKTLDDRFSSFQKDLYQHMHQHIGALMEDNHHQVQILIEAFQGRFERIERRMDLKPWGM